MRPMVERTHRSGEKEPMPIQETDNSFEVSMLAGQTDRPGTGLTFQCAHTIDEVVDAWQLVYTAYRRKKLIHPNRQRLHTTRYAVGNHATVITGRMGPLVVSTMTAILDNPVGLPLDRVYSDDLDSLRARGRKMMEISLFADRRENLARSSASLLQLMRFAWQWGISKNVTDFVIGVHPRHARFYSRAFGFEPSGPERTYPAVNDHPVVFLRGEPAIQLARNPMPRGLEYFAQNPIDPAEFERRYRFPTADVGSSPIDSFLNDSPVSHCDDGEV